VTRAPPSLACGQAVTPARCSAVGWTGGVDLGTNLLFLWEGTPVRCPWGRGYAGLWPTCQWQRRALGSRQVRSGPRGDFFRCLRINTGISRKSSLIYQICWFLRSKAWPKATREKNRILLGYRLQGSATQLYHRPAFIKGIQQDLALYLTKFTGQPHTCSPLPTKPTQNLLYNPSWTSIQTHPTPVTTSSSGTCQTTSTSRSNTARSPLYFCCKKEIGLNKMALGHVIILFFKMQSFLFNHNVEFFFFSITQYRSRYSYIYDHSPLWIHGRTPYPYEYIWKTGSASSWDWRSQSKIVSLSTEMSPTTERIISYKYTTHTSNLRFKPEWLGSITRNLTIWTRASLPGSFYFPL
jgi:hypothetical protein